MVQRTGSGDERGDGERAETGGPLRESRAFQGPAEPPDGHDHATDHLALVYGAQDEQFESVVPFLHRGLVQDERCLYVADESSREAILAALRDHGIDVETALETGALDVVTAADIYRRDGEFDREAMLDFWRRALDDARSDGFTGIRAAAEMTWALDSETCTDELVEYEALLNPLYEDDDYTVLCQYDRTRFPDEVVHDVIKTHPLVVQDNTVSQNVYYTPPESFFAAEQPADKVDRKLRTLRERTESRTALRDNEQHLHELYEIIADTDASFDEKLQAIFDLGCERFDMEVGGLARVDPDTDGFEIEATNGDHDDLVPESQYPLSETYCRATVDDGGTCAITDSTGFEDRLCHDQFGVRTYLGTYLEFEDGEDRTFWFVSGQPREEISTGERAFHHLMGQWVKYELEQERQTDQFVALNNLNETTRDINRALARQSSRGEVEQVVCDRLAGADSYAFAWVGTVKDGDVVPTTSSDVRASVDEMPDVGDDDLADRAARAGELQVVRDIETSDGAEPGALGIAGMASVPIAYEDEQYGVLTVYTTRDRAFGETEQGIIAQLGEIVGLAIAAVEHERELEHERERLEFFNRLVRHNVLNSLNVVQARTEILEEFVDTGGVGHLETIRERTDGMIDLVEGLRTLMKAVVETGEHQLEPTDLRAVLGMKVEQARQTFADATFDIRGDWERAGEVLADDLLGEVFENLLVNAVQHNDKPDPRVTVGVETGSETVTVRIADNGPGVPDELVDQIFEKGVKGFDSPGTGFGLHLVREIVDAYGGDITVENRDPEGAVFAISLPRAEPAD